MFKIKIQLIKTEPNSFNILHDEEIIVHQDLVTTENIFEECLRVIKKEVV